MNTYLWSISALDCKPEEDGYKDCVITAHWRVDATDGIYTAGVYGTQSFSLNTEGDFTPFEDLTQEQVVTWVQESMGIDAVTALQENLDKQIDDQIDPPIITPPLPWVSNTTLPV